MRFSFNLGCTYPNQLPLDMHTGNPTFTPVASVHTSFRCFFFLPSGSFLLTFCGILRPLLLYILGLNCIFAPGTHIPCSNTLLCFITTQYFLRSLARFGFFGFLGSVFCNFFFSRRTVYLSLPFLFCSAVSFWVVWGSLFVLGDINLCGFLLVAFCSYNYQLMESSTLSAPDIYIFLCMPRWAAVARGCGGHVCSIVWVRGGSGRCGVGGWVFVSICRWSRSV